MLTCFTQPICNSRSAYACGLHRPKYLCVMDSVDGQDCDEFFDPPLSPSCRDYIDHGDDVFLRGVKHDQVPQESVVNVDPTEVVMETTPQAPATNNGFTERYNNAANLLSHPEQSIHFESNPVFDDMCMDYIQTGVLHPELERSLYETDCREQRISQIVAYLKDDAPTPKLEESQDDLSVIRDDFLLDDLVDICGLRRAAEPETQLLSHPITQTDGEVYNSPDNQPPSEGIFYNPSRWTPSDFPLSDGGGTQNCDNNNDDNLPIKYIDPAPNSVRSEEEHRVNDHGETTNSDDDFVPNNDRFAGNVIYPDHFEKTQKKRRRNTRKGVKECIKKLQNMELEKKDSFDTSETTKTKKGRRGRRPVGNEPTVNSKKVAKYRNTTKDSGTSADGFIKKCFECSFAFEEPQRMMLCETYEFVVKKLAKKCRWDKEELLKKVEFHKPTFETLHPRYGPGRADNPDDAQMRSIKSGPRVPLLLLYDQLLQLQKKQVTGYNSIMQDLKENCPKLYDDLTTTCRRLISRELSNPPHQGPLIPTAEPNQATTNSRKRVGDNSAGPTSRVKRGKFV
uniref:Helitron_like_N domain-containing protein n=1 Tax=Panagrellus redivivus TaxID=6233 RepID=A0A7E4WBY2_PANRE